MAALHTFCLTVMCWSASRFLVSVTEEEEKLTEKKFKRKKDPGFRNQVPEETSPYLLLGAQDQGLCAEQDQRPSGSTGTSFGNCQEMGSRMVRACHTTTASPKLSCRAPWKMGDAVVSRGNAGWTTSKDGHPSPCQNCLQ